MSRERVDTLSVRMRMPLDRFELDVEFTTRERVTGLFGASGSGKTTLLRGIAGIHRSFEGRIILGDRLFHESERRLSLKPEERQVGYVPQQSLLFPHLNVRDNLLSSRRAGESASDRTPLYQRVLNVLGLEDLLERRTDTLSGGERQRVSLGRALCSDPSLLLLDEPLSSIDEPLRQRVLPFLERTVEEFAIPVLLVSHDRREIDALCGEVLLIENGRLKE